MMATDLSAYLLSIGLQNARVDGDEIHALCPAHEERTGHVDAHPSFGFNMAKQVGNCFSCGWHPTLPELVRQLTGTAPPADIMEQAQSSATVAAIKRLTEEKREALIDFTLHEWTLTHRFKDVKSSMLERRRLTAEAAAAYGIRFDPYSRTWVMPIRTARGVLVGWQRKGGGLKAFNEPKNLEKSQHLFGLYSMRAHDRLAVVESPLDAVRLYQVGIPAVSTMGAEVSDAQCRLLARHTSTVVLAMDNDPAGWHGAKIIRDRLRNTSTAILQWDYDAVWKANEWKDPGDCPEDRILKRTWERTIRFGL